MALTNLGPFPLPVQNATGAVFTIIPAGQYSGPGIAGQVLMTNFSGYVVAMFSSSQGSLPNLNPGEVAAYDVPKGGGSLTATILSGTPTVANPQLTAQLGTDGESFQGNDATFPGAYPFSLPLVAPTFNLLQTLGAGGTTITVMPSGTAVQLLVFGALSAVGCNGASSGLPLAVTSAAGLIAIPLPGSTGDQATGYTITLAAAQATPIWIYQSSVNVLSINAAGQPGVVVLSNPGAGLDWSFQIGGAVRLVQATAILETSAAVANRLPLLEIVFGASTVGYYPGSAGALTASHNGFYTWADGVGLTGMLTGAGISLFSTAPLPRVDLQGAAIIKTNTQNLDAADQWASIMLTFSPI